MVSRVMLIGLAAVVAGLGQARAAEEAPARVRVLEGRAAVYASTNASREAVGWVPAGSELAVRGEWSDESPWVRVEPPDSVSVWIYRELVRDGAVTADKSRVRSGAGLNFRAVASLSRGDRVEVRGSYGDWLRIRPPEGVELWVLRDQVEPLAELPAADMREAPPLEPAAELAATNAAAVSAPAAAEPLAPAPAAEALQPPPGAPAPALPPALAGALLADAPGQGTRTVVTGLLDWGAVGAFRAPFCLLEQRGEEGARPACHLVMPAALGAPLVGAEVRAEGTRWLLRGVALPVVVAESVSEVQAR